MSSIPSELELDSHFVDVLGTRIHYFDEGSGPAAVFLHGNPVWSYLWRNVIPHVRPVARCLAMDLVGMGRSGKPDLEYTFFDHARYIDGFINALGLEDVVLVLHDWGTALGVHWALHNDSRVRAIATVANGGRLLEGVLAPVDSWSDVQEGAREMLQSYRTPGLGWELVAEQNTFVEGLAQGGFSEEAMRYYNEPYTSAKDRKAVWAWPQQIPIEGEPAAVVTAVRELNAWLRGSSLPKLLVHGASDQPQEMVDWFRNELSNVELVDVGPCGHYLQEDVPEPIGRALANWIGRL